MKEITSSQLKELQAGNLILGVAIGCTLEALRTRLFEQSTLSDKPDTTQDGLSENVETNQTPLFLSQFIETDGQIGTFQDSFEIFSDLIPIDIFFVK